MAAQGKRPMGADTADQFAKELRTWANKLTQIATIMRDNGIEQINVLNQPNAAKGLMFVERLVQSSERALNEQLREELRGN